MSKLMFFAVMLVPHFSTRMRNSKEIAVTSVFKDHYIYQVLYSTLVNLIFELKDLVPARPHALYPT